MGLDDLPLFAMLKNRLSYLNDRQGVIAQNVANSDTPGFTPKDLKPFSAGGGQGALAMAPVSTPLTSPMHIELPSTRRPSSAQQVASPDTETTLSGNSVVLEDEMMKMGEARIDYDAAVGFYQKSLALLQMAIKRPGQ